MTQSTPTHVLYLHGFRSSPQSNKARILETAIQRRSQPDQPLTWACPQLPPSPDDALAVMLATVNDWPRDRMAVIGSSLGGFYATVLAERLGCPAVVINPAVAPARDLARYIGEQTHFHNPADRFFFRAEFIGQFEAMDPYPLPHPERYHALIAEGDEVLDWREMVAHYEGAAIKLLDGSDHAISEFTQYVDEVLGWLGLPSNKMGQSQP